jgi:putative ABC transport system permease protein
MQNVIDISWFYLALFCASLLVPAALNRHFELGLGREALVSLLRMTLQLLLVGIYLEYLFDLNNVWVNLAWLIVMVLVASNAILNKSQLAKRLLLPVVAIALCIGLIPLLATLCLLVVQPTPLYSAQYMIPLAGMLLGNSLSGNIIALQHFFTSLEERWSEYEAAISLGAHPKLATLPFLQAALQKAMAPIIATMATTGLVSLPGMMTGQILGGASPIVAIKYQLLIMIAIFVMMSISLSFCLKFTVARAITPNGKVLITFNK